MIPEKTTVVRLLDNHTVEKLKEELSKVSWTEHHDSEKYKRGGALRFGETSWIMKCTEWLYPLISNEDKFPESKKIAESFLGENHILGRQYWHRLNPGDIIELHDDSKLGFSEKILKRYQVFLDMPEGFTVFCDNEDKDPRSFMNAIVDFNLFAPHAYANNSKETVYLMVFDIFDKNNLPGAPT